MSRWMSTWVDGSWGWMSCGELFLQPNQVSEAIAIARNTGSLNYND